MRRDAGDARGRCARHNRDQGGIDPGGYQRTGDDSRALFGQGRVVRRAAIGPSLDRNARGMEFALCRGDRGNDLLRLVGQGRGVVNEIDEIIAWLGKVRGTQLVYLEDMSGDDGDNDFLDRHVSDDDSNPLAQLQDHRMRAALIEAIKVLPEREQYVMSMYYEHDMNLKEIAAVLKVTESRVCQLHSQSIARLRVKLRAY